MGSNKVRVLDADRLGALWDSRKGSRRKVPGKSGWISDGAITGRLKRGGKAGTDDRGPSTPQLLPLQKTSVGAAGAGIAFQQQEVAADEDVEEEDAEEEDVEVEDVEVETSWRLVRWQGSRSSRCRKGRRQSRGSGPDVARELEAEREPRPDHALDEIGELLAVVAPFPCSSPTPTQPRDSASTPPRKQDLFTTCVIGGPTNEGSLASSCYRACSISSPRQKIYSARPRHPRPPCAYLAPLSLNTDIINLGRARRDGPNNEIQHRRAAEALRLRYADSLRYHGRPEHR
jgi:hypothetical protein